MGNILSIDIMENLVRWWSIKEFDSVFDLLTHEKWNNEILDCRKKKFG